MERDRIGRETRSCSWRLFSGAKATSQGCGPGSATTRGLPAFAGAVVPVDAPVVERMRAAGAIAIGRTNLADMALGSSHLRTGQFC